MELSQRQIAMGALALGGLLLLWKFGTRAAGYVVNVFERGARLNHTTAVDGIVPDEPDNLIAEAAAVMGEEIGDDTYALARMGRSEGVDGMEFRMHVALNDLEALQVRHGRGVYSSVLAMMLHSKDPEADGRFSAQSRGKRYATTRDPYAGDVQLARKVRTDRENGIDPTFGAVKFVDKSGLDDYPALVASWAKEGLEPLTLDGASDNFVVFTRTTQVG